MTQKQITACQIFATTFFDENVRSRFVGLITAVEALLEPKQREAEAVLLVAQFRRMVAVSSLPKATKDSMRGTLKWLQDESINQTGRRLATRLLGGKTFDGKTPEKFFSECYEIRSSIVHRGSAAQGVNLLNAVNLAQDFVGELLLASIDSGATKVQADCATPRASHDEIAAAAYTLWLARGGATQLNPAVVDWLDAESILNGGGAP